MKGETKSLEQDVHLSSRFRVRLYIRYSCPFPMAHLALFPLCRRDVRKARCKRDLILKPSRALARILANVTTQCELFSPFFHSRSVHIYLSYTCVVSESNEVYLMTAEGLRTLTTIRGKFYVRSDTRGLSFATTMGSLKKEESLRKKSILKSLLSIRKTLVRLAL